MTAHETTAYELGRAQERIRWLTRALTRLDAAVRGLEGEKIEYRKALALSAALKDSAIALSVEAP